MNETEEKIVKEVEDLFKGIDTSKVKDLRVGAEPIKVDDELTFKTPTKEVLKTIFSGQTFEANKVDGDKIVTDESGKNVKETRTWFAFPEEHGRQISVARLIRIGNGLPLKGVTPIERVKSFVTLIGTFGGTLTLKVESMKDGRKFPGQTETPKIWKFAEITLPD